MKKYLFLFLLVFITSCRTKPMHVLCIGDSLLSGYGIDKEESVKNILSKKYDFIIDTYVDVGLTSKRFLFEFTSIELTQYYDCVLLELGANDYLMNQDASDTIVNLQKIIDILKNKCKSIIIVSFIDDSMFEINNSGFNKDLLIEYKQMYESLANQENVHLFDSYWKGEFSKLEKKVDFFHPNESLSKEIANRLYLYIKDFNM